MTQLSDCAIKNLTDEGLNLERSYYKCIIYLTSVIFSHQQ